MKKLLLCSLLLTALSFTSSAYEKYQYAMVRLATGMIGSYNGIWVCYAGKDWQQEVKLDKKELTGVLYTNCGPMLTYLEKMTASGWELYSTNLSDQLYFFRKKVD